MTDTDTPITARSQVTVAAPIERVWEILSDPVRWPTIEPDVHDVRLDGGVVEGARFTWRYGRTRLTSTFTVVDADRELSWTSTAPGIRAAHRNVLSIDDDDQAHLLSEASLAGPLPAARWSEAKLRSALDHGLGCIAAAAVTATTNDFMAPSEWLADIEEAVLDPVAAPEEGASDGRALTPGASTGRHLGSV